jgi:hypothetical protein
MLLNDVHCDLPVDNESYGVDVSTLAKRRDKEPEAGAVRTKNALSSFLVRPTRNDNSNAAEANDEEDEEDDEDAQDIMRRSILLDSFARQARSGLTKAHFMVRPTRNNNNALKSSFMTRPTRSDAARAHFMVRPTRGDSMKSHFMVRPTRGDSMKAHFMVRPTRSDYLKSHFMVRPTRGDSMKAHFMVRPTRANTNGLDEARRMEVEGNALAQAEVLDALEDYFIATE